MVTAEGFRRFHAEKDLDAEASIPEIIKRAVEERIVEEGELSRVKLEETGT